MSHSATLLPRVCGVIIAGSLALASTTVAEGADYDDIPKHFFELVAKGDFGAAIDYAGGTSPHWDPDLVDSMRKQVTKALGAYGEYAYHEFLSEQKIGTRYVRCYYIIGYEKGLIGVTLSLYRPKDKWIVHALNTTDNVEVIRGNFPPK